MIEPAPLVYQDDAVTNLATRPGLLTILREVKDQNLSELSFSFVVWLVMTGIWALHTGTPCFIVLCFIAFTGIFFWFVLFFKLKAKPFTSKRL